jgi:hypothetical protein
MARKNQLKTIIAKEGSENYPQTKEIKFKDTNTDFFGMVHRLAGESEFYKNIEERFKFSYFDITSDFTAATKKPFFKFKNHSELAEDKRNKYKRKPGLLTTEGQTAAQLPDIEDPKADADKNRHKSVDYCKKLSKFGIRAEKLDIKIKTDLVEGWRDFPEPDDVKIAQNEKFIHIPKISLLHFTTVGGIPDLFDPKEAIKKFKDSGKLKMKSVRKLYISVEYFWNLWIGQDVADLLFYIFWLIFVFKFKTNQNELLDSLR